MEENIMAILETLARSRRLYDKRSVVILMYPSHLKDQVKPGQADALPWIDREKPPNTCSSQ